MDIQNINPGSNISADQLRSGTAEEANSVERVSRTEEVSESTKRSAEDRVEISEEGRAAQQTNGTDAHPDLEKARKAMLDIPPLSPSRAADIFKRVQAGYYSQPRSIDMIAENIASEMMGEPPTGASSEAPEGGGNA